MNLMTNKEAEKLAERLGQEKRQEILDYFKTGKSIRETRIHFDLDMMVVVAIINANIESDTHYSLREKSK